MKARVWLVVLGLLFAVAAYSQEKESVDVFDLFRGDTRAAQDSSDYISPWIPVRGANRIVLRTWSANSNSYTGADSCFVDSLSLARVMFSDSVSFIGRDSLGTLVTYRPTIPYSSDHGITYPVCADSVMFTIGLTTTAGVDTTRKHIAAAQSPAGRVLRPAVSGSGVYTFIWPTTPNAATGVIWGDGAINAGYMRVRYSVPVRLTTAGFSSSQGIRTRGVNGLRCKAYVYFK